MIIRIARQFGQCIRARRIALGWTQDELARKASVSRSTVYRLEVGTTTSLYPGKLLEILDALGLEVSVDLKRDAVARTPGEVCGRIDEGGASHSVEAAPQAEPDPTLDSKAPTLAALLAMGDAYKDYAAKLKAADASALLDGEGAPCD